VGAIAVLADSAGTARLAGGDQGVEGVGAVAGPPLTPGGAGVQAHRPRTRAAPGSRRDTMTGLSIPRPSRVRQFEVQY
jgi:hypothetical protein